jgi:hypothetical protein
MKSGVNPRPDQGIIIAVLLNGAWKIIDFGVESAARHHGPGPCSPWRPAW